MDICSSGRKESSGVIEASGCTGDCEESITHFIKIEINSIENIIKDGTLNLKIAVEHADEIIAESSLYRINSVYEKITNEYILEFSAILPYNADDMKSVCAVVSHPVMITVYDVEDKNSSITAASYDSGDNQGKVFGMCNLDLVPIIFGEEEFEEKLVLEAPSLAWDSRVVSWENLPKLHITALRSGNSDNACECNCFNLMSITVESIYNLPESFDENTEYKCATPLFSETPETFIAFEAGKWTNFKDIEQMKVWLPFQHLDSRAKFSKYTLDSDYTKAQNDLECGFNLKQAAKSNAPRIEWNCMYRFALDKEGVQKVKDHLKKYKYWPFEIMLTENKVSPAGFDESKSTIYQCFVDAGQLLYPGRTTARVLAQLYKKNLPKMEEKTGLPISIFEYLSKSKGSTEKINSSDSSESNIPEGVEEYPIFTDEGRPVLLLVEFELWRPFFKARVLEDYTEALEKLRHKPKPTHPVYYYTPDLVQDRYIDCCQQMSDVIVKEYRDFLGKCECEDIENISNVKTNDTKNNLCRCESTCSSESFDDMACPYYYIPDEQDRFKQYLYKTGKYKSIRSTLKKNICHVLDQKFALNYDNWYSQRNQNLVASAFSYFVEEMHTALNTKLDVRLSSEYSKLKIEDDYWYRSEEAYEYGDFQKSESLLTKIVSVKRNCANSWILYAVYFMKKSQIDEAIECCREAVKLNSRHKVGLIFYGVLLAMKEEFTDAEIFLKAVTYLYPRSTEAWTILHIFYIKIQYHPGIDLTLRIAEQCLQDQERDDESDCIIFLEEPMAWSTLLGHINNVFALTTVLLLRLSLNQYAALTLLKLKPSCDECLCVVYYYFLSVVHYMQNNYEVAIPCLNKARELLGMDYSLASLQGHCFFKIGKLPKAIEFYEAADSLYERPENIHLIHMRMGFYYNDIEDYERARNTFLRASKYPPTSKTWLGLGISCYHLKRFEECEIALIEANRIDDEDPVIWGYLCLLSMALHRYHEFTQCYRQTVKNKLKSDKLWNLIQQQMDILDYRVPISTFEYSNKKCSC